MKKTKELKATKQTANNDLVASQQGVTDNNATTEANDDINMLIIESNIYMKENDAKLNELIALKKELADKDSRIDQLTEVVKHLDSTVDIIDNNFMEESLKIVNAKDMIAKKITAYEYELAKEHPFGSDYPALNNTHKQVYFNLIKSLKWANSLL